jgi:NADH:ubiquinone oxidoreductase subunit C
VELIIPPENEDLDICGVDHPSRKRRFEIVYNFLPKTKIWIFVELIIPPENEDLKQFIIY